MKKRICQVAITGCSLALTGCLSIFIPPNKVSKNCNPSSSRIEELETNSNSIQPIVQIDGTPSMQGFVNVPKSRYISTLRLIDNAVNEAFANSLPIKYYTFGTKRIALPKEKSSLIAQRQSFYEKRTEYLLDAQIDKAIQPLNKNNQNDLSIIITDLYQKNGEIKPVISSLKNYLEKGLAVGILAVRSEFNGMVYDIGLTNDSFKKITKTGKMETFQPFYIIVLGSYENVASFFDRMKEASQNVGLNFSNQDFLIFYPRLIKTPLVLNIKEDNLSVNGITRILTVNYRRRLWVVPTDKQMIERLMLRDEGSHGQKINYQVAYERLPYLLPVTKFSANVTTEYNNKGRELDELSNLNGEQLIEFNDWEIKENKLLFSTMFNYNDMDEGIYWFSAEVFPIALGLPQWSSQWNLKEQETFNPSKSQTYNLLPFLDGLKATTLRQIEEKNQPIGRFCYLNIVYKKP